MKSDQDSLQMEVLRLRQQQENTQSHLAAVEERIRTTEAKQKHTALFLIKFLKKPELLLQQFSEKSTKIKARSDGGSSKKRRLAIPYSLGDGSLTEPTEAINNNDEIASNHDKKKIQFQEKMAKIQSEMEILFPSNDQQLKAEIFSETNSSQNYMLLEKIMEDDMIYDNGAAASKQQSDIVSQLEELIARPSECGVEMRGVVETTVGGRLTY